MKKTTIVTAFTALLFFNFNGQVEAQNDVDWPRTLPPGTWQSTCSGNKITFDQATHKCKLETTCDDHLGTPKDTTIEWEVHFISYDQFQNCDGVLQNLGTKCEYINPSSPSKQRTN